MLLIVNSGVVVGRNDFPRLCKVPNVCFKPSEV